MPFKAEFVFETLSDLQDFIKTTERVTLPAPTPVSVAKPAKAGKAPKPEPLEEKMPLFMGNKKIAVEDTVQEPALTYEYVAKATTDAIAACGGSQPVKDLLKDEFKVESAKLLDKSDWAAYVRRCGDLIKQAASEGELA